MNQQLPQSPLSPTSFLSANQLSSFFLRPVNPTEVSNVIFNLKKKSRKLNKLPTFLLIAAREYLSKPLAHIINESFKSGNFPKSLKLAEVIPIFKSGDPLDKSNYRPISLLSVYSKIIEKCVANRLTDFFEKSSIISKAQYGFLKNRNTTDALLDYVNFIYKSLNDRKHAVSVFVDMKKAFDVVDHNILLKKMEIYGIRGIALSWFRNYLAERYQFVRIGDCFSEVRPIITGVPQGSVLGPLFFILFINDFPSS